MTVLILAEHNGAELNAATLHAIAAAEKLGDVHVLVAGSGC
ncbi:electron transfer flavoprotein subunit alpha/FixB family protein, partial [Kingella kingae]|nr:electron transfer flavoprotein subunit alpha/FixB family protein [Kingella kingae]